MLAEKPQWESLWEMNRLIIIGASGHGKVVADIARLCGYEDIVFLDGDASVKSCAGYPVIGLDSEASNFKGDIFVAIGNNTIRKRLMMENSGRFFPVLIHPSAIIAKETKIGKGSVIMAGAVVNSDASLGSGVIVNTCSSVDHDCQVGSYCHIAIGAHLSGSVILDDNVWVGAGAIISNNISICPETTIGAGAVVVKDIRESGIYIGVPARRK